jgi:acyl-coenzyme A synthetase/AMP-(fatty) acid ligase
MLEIMKDLPRTPTGKIQKGPLSKIVQDKYTSGSISRLRQIRARFTAPIGQ